MNLEAFMSPDAALSALRRGRTELALCILWRDGLIRSAILFLYGLTAHSFVGLTSFSLNTPLLHSLILSVRRCPFCCCTLGMEKVTRRCWIKRPRRCLVYHLCKVIKVVL